MVLSHNILTMLMDVIGCQIYEAAVPFDVSGGSISTRLRIGGLVEDVIKRSDIFPNVYIMVSL